MADGHSIEQLADHTEEPPWRVQVSLGLLINLALRTGNAAPRPERSEHSKGAAGAAPVAA
jgi:hypothetical protein